MQSVIPERASVGEADIACLSHIGLAMLGEGEVFYIGKGTKAAYDSIRKAIPFYERDRNISVDISNAYKVLRSGRLLSDVRAAMNK